MRFHFEKTQLTKIILLDYSKYRGLLHMKALKSVCIFLAQENEKIFVSDVIYSPFTKAQNQPNISLGKHLLPHKKFPVVIYCNSCVTEILVGCFFLKCY